MTTGAGERGAALVEALAGLVLAAMAGAIVAAAATTSLRAGRQAAVTERLVVIAARELTALQARGAPACADEAVLTEPGLGADVLRRASVTRGTDGIADLSVTVAAAPYPPVTLATRMFLPE